MKAIRNNKERLQMSRGGEDCKLALFLGSSLDLRLSWVAVPHLAKVNSYYSTLGPGEILLSQWTRGVSAVHVCLVTCTALKGIVSLPGRS